jgi:hypothetical protein
VDVAGVEVVEDVVGHVAVVVGVVDVEGNDRVFEGVDSRV